MIPTLIARSSTPFGSRVTFRATIRVKAKLLLPGMFAPRLGPLRLLAPSFIRRCSLYLLGPHSASLGPCCDQGIERTISFYNCCGFYERMAFGGSERRAGFGAIGLLLYTLKN